MTDRTERVDCYNEASRLLPWFVMGALSDRDAERVRVHLRECPLCAADFEREQQVRSLIDSEPTVEHAPQPGLHRLMSRIDEFERELPESPAGPAAIAAPARSSRVVHWLAAAVIVQAVGLGILGSLLWNRGVELRQPRFHTMSSPPAAEGGGAAQIRVVFDSAMTTGDVRDLLREIRAAVIAGPSEAGVYTLALRDARESVDAALARLRSSPGVSFAEPQSIAQRGEP